MQKGYQENKEKHSTVRYSTLWIYTTAEQIVEDSTLNPQQENTFISYVGPLRP